MNTQKIGAGVMLVMGALALGCGGKTIDIEEENGGSGGSSGAGGSSGTGTGGSSSAGGDPGSGGNSGNGGSGGVGGGSGGTSASGGDGGGSIVASDGDSAVTETCAFPPASANACVLCKGKWYCSWQLNHKQPVPTCPADITLETKGCTIGCVQCLDGGTVAVQWGCTEDNYHGEGTVYVSPTTDGLSCEY